MLNQMASSSGEPKMYSATYVENYLDSVENLPNDVQRYLTRIREIDLQCKVHLRDVDYYYEQWSNCSSNEAESANSAPSKRARAMARIQQNLIAAQELGDEKLQVVTQLQEMIDQKTRQLDADFKNLEYADKDDPALMDNSPNPNTNPASPSSYVPSLNLQRSDDGSMPGSSGTSSSLNNERNGGNSNIGNNANSSNSHNADRNSKRSRRARESSARSGNNSSNFSNMSKTSQIDLASDSNNSNSNQSNKNASTSGQQSNAGGSSNSNRKQGTNNGGGGSNNNKKRKRKSARSQNGGNGGNNSNNSSNTNQSNARLHDEPSPLDETIDPDEPTYCLCDQISFGEMILCDNDLCPIEWFHFSCVSLTTKPKGKWYCPLCRGDRPGVMKPKQQFLKELERYNREKEEKS